MRKNATCTQSRSLSDLTRLQYERRRSSTDSSDSQVEPVTAPTLLEGEQQMETEDVAPAERRQRLLDKMMEEKRRIEQRVQNRKQRAPVSYWPLLL